MILRTIILSFLFILIYSCTKYEDGGSRYIKQSVYNTFGVYDYCHLVCIGERNFKNDARLFKDYNEQENIHGNYCEKERFSWDAINQEKNDNGNTYICSGQVHIWSSRTESEWHCNVFNLKESEEKQIIKNLKLCNTKAQKDVHSWGSNGIKLPSNNANVNKEISFEERLVDLQSTCKKIGFIEKKDVADCSLEIWKTEQQIKNDKIANNALQRSSRAQSLNSGLNLMLLGLGIANVNKPKLVCQKPDLFGNVKCF